MQAFDGLLRSLPCHESLRAYSEADVTEKLIRRCNFRRRVSEELSTTVAAGFGTNDDYRRHGIWSALARVCDFHLYEVPDEPIPGTKTEEENLIAKQRGFLNFVDALERKQKNVHCALFTHSGRHISDELLNELHKRGIWTIISSVDDKSQFIRPKCALRRQSHQLRVASKCDLYWTTWKVGTLLVSDLGGNPWYAAEGADPHYFCPMPVHKDLEVVFIGACYGMRPYLIEYLRCRGITVTARGNGWPDGPVPSLEMVEFFSRAKIVLGIGGVGYTQGIKHLKGRDFEVPMCGAVYVTSYNPELSDFFSIGREIVCYSSFEECLQELVWLLINESAREEMGKAARARCVAEHSWDRRIEHLLGFLAAASDCRASQDQG